MITLKNKKNLALTVLSIILLLNPLSFLNIIEISHASENVEMEWWTETEIFPEAEYSLNEVLVYIYDHFIEVHRPDVLSWHFFRENGALRFRIESRTESSRDLIAQKLEIFLDEFEMINSYFFACQGTE